MSFVVRAILGDANRAASQAVLLRTVGGRNLARHRVDYASWPRGSSLPIECGAQN